MIRIRLENHKSLLKYLEGKLSNLQHKLKDFSEIIASWIKLKDKLQTEKNIWGRYQTKLKILYYIMILYQTLWKLLSLRNNGPTTWTDYLQRKKCK